MRVTEIDHGGGVVTYELRAESDMGKVIGRRVELLALSGP